MCVYIYICAYVYMYVCVCMYVYGCVYVCECTVTYGYIPEETLLHGGEKHGYMRLVLGESPVLSASSRVMLGGHVPYQSSIPY